MRVYPVQSSNIDHIGYDRQKMILAVIFHSGQAYQYEGVEVKIFGELLSAESIGSAFHTLIKSNPNRYPYQKVDVEIMKAESATIGQLEILG